jgi:hypothetical protein
MRESLRLAMVSGACAAAASALVLAWRGRVELGSGAAPLNGPSQWLWGRHAKYRDDVSARHTAIGYGIHHLAATMWALPYESARAGSDDPRRIAACAAGAAALAALVDYGPTPTRLRPGFEKRLSLGSLCAVYAAFAAGLALPALAAGLRLSDYRPKQAGAPHFKPPGSQANQENDMSDNKGNRGSPDRDRIDINDPDEVRNWTKSLGVSKEELQRAVQAAGDRAEKVREFLRGRSH